MSKKATGNAALNTQGGVVDTKAEADAYFGLEKDKDYVDTIETSEGLKKSEDLDLEEIEPQTSEDVELDESVDETPKPSYNKIPNLSFGRATEVLRTGLGVSRLAWHGESVQLQQPDAHSMNTLPYFVLNTASGGKIPWSPSHEDLLAVDWIVVEE